MRYGILGDIHGNLDALDAVLATLDSEKLDGVYCIGDIVGYGAEPSACLRRLRDHQIPSVAGNHDYAAAGKIDIEYFNDVATEAIHWTTSALASQELLELSQLPLVKTLPGMTLVHASLANPAEFEYVLDWEQAQSSLDRLEEGDVCFFGHSHVPLTFLEGANLLVTTDEVVNLGLYRKALVNVGSVGQPRDGDPRASCVVFDGVTRIFTRHRVPYDIDAAASKILAAGLPSILAERLRVGS